MTEKEIGIYIHIPFCKRKCYYCDFISYCNQDENIDRYIDALIKEIRNRKKKSRFLYYSQQNAGNLEPFGLDSSFNSNTVLNITPYFLWNKC